MKWNTDINACCPKCHKQRTDKGHDPCIADLPGVMFACCGHGVHEGYLYFENGVRIGMNVIEVDKHSTRTDVPVRKARKRRAKGKA